MVIRPTLIAMLFVGICLVHGSCRDVWAADDPELRGWQRGTRGQMTMDGRLITVDNRWVKFKDSRGKISMVKGIAKIRTRSGKVVQIPVEQLFPKDREYVENWLKSSAGPATKKQGVHRTAFPRHTALVVRRQKCQCSSCFSVGDS